MDSSSGWSGGDDRWKLSNSKKGGRSRSGRPHAMDASKAGGASMLSRSYSASVSSSRSTTIRSTSTAAAATTGSSSGSSSWQQAAAGGGHQAESSSSSSSSSRLSKKKCVEAVKEHRARFYIVRRCVSMLVCWRDY